MLSNQIPHVITLMKKTLSVLTCYKELNKVTEYRVEEKYQKKILESHGKCMTKCLCKHGSTSSVPPDISNYCFPSWASACIVQIFSQEDTITREIIKDSLRT